MSISRLWTWSLRRYLLIELLTLSFGGGTPGLLSAKDLDRLGTSMLARLPSPPKEWTVEMAPSTVKADKLEFCADLE